MTPTRPAVGSRSLPGVNRGSGIHHVGLQCQATAFASAPMARHTTSPTVTGSARTVDAFGKRPGAWQVASVRLCIECLLIFALERAGEPNTFNFQLSNIIFRQQRLRSGSMISKNVRPPCAAALGHKETMPWGCLIPKALPSVTAGASPLKFSLLWGTASWCLIALTFWQGDGIRRCTLDTMPMRSGHGSFLSNPTSRSFQARNVRPCSQ